MKLEIETKYNIGDVLYYADADWNIVKTKVEYIEVRVRDDSSMLVRYGFTTGEVALEGFMDNYFNTAEEAGAYFAKVAIENMTEA